MAAPRIERSRRDRAPRHVVGVPFAPHQAFTRYVQVPMPLLQYTALGSSTKLLLARLLFFAGRSEYCFPSIHTLAHELGVKDRAIQYGLAELERLRFIEREQRPGRANRYYILWHVIYETGMQ